MSFMSPALAGRFFIIRVTSEAQNTPTKRSYLHNTKRNNKIGKSYLRELIKKKGGEILKQHLKILRTVTKNNF